MTEKTYAFGKLPAVPGAIKFQFASYFSKPDLPKPPDVFGVWQSFWNIKMFQNDRIGNCVMAGAANETASYYRDTGRWVEFMDENVIQDYTTLSGYNPAKKYDPGLEMSKAAEYRRNIGIVDRYGRRHKIDAYVGLPKRDFDTLKIAMYLFGAVGIGFEMPDHAQKDFNRKIPWKVWGKPKIVGGHYVPGCGIDKDGDIIIITWGKYHKVTREFYETYNDETCAYFSMERIINKTSPEGFHADKLLSDLRSLKSWFGYEGGFRDVYNWPVEQEA